MNKNPRKSIGDKLDAKNIALVVENDVNLSKQFEYLSARLNVFRKSGIFDEEKAKKMLLHLADAGAREATRLIHRKPASEYTKFFSAETRRMAADGLLKMYLGSSDHSSKKYKDYKYLVVDEDMNIYAGNEFREDAIDAMNDLKESPKKLNLRVITSKFYKSKTNKDHRDYDNWKEI